MRMPWGKHAGKELEDVPEDYLVWVLDHCENASPTLRRAIRAQLGLDEPESYYRPPPPPPPRSGPIVSQETVSRWYRKLALKYHPDRGGSAEVMQAINDAKEMLLRELGFNP